MTLHLHRAERADRLVDALGELFLHPLPDPMAPEIVSVPTRGVERWITQRLSNVLGTGPGRHGGVCANIDFPFPSRLIGTAVAEATSGEQATDIWRPERLVWPLLDVVEECLGEQWLATLTGYLTGDDAAADRRFGAVRHVADLFDHYSVHRPVMLRAWRNGDDVDGHNRPLPPDGVWQAELWRRLREAVGVSSPAERLPDACARIRDDPMVLTLPGRFAIFGLTRLPASHVEVLHAIAEYRDVHLFLLHPSPMLWDHVSECSTGGVVPRAEDVTRNLPTNPLLRSWGRDTREMQVVLTHGADSNVVHHHYASTEGGATLLARIQSGIHADSAPDRYDQAEIDPDDRSLQIHSCHGQARQVEVLRDAILHLLRDDPTLEPRDVIVMCPDIETFAPLIHATFGSGASSALADTLDADRADESIDLRVRLADRSIRQTNPVLAAVTGLLVLAEARLTASQVLDLASQDAVRRRFEFDDEDLARLEEWVTGSGIRWGLDGTHRTAYGLEHFDANTWRTGLDRILLGATITEDDLALVAGVLPLDDVSSGDLELVGKFAEFVARLGAVIDSFGRRQTVVDWANAIGFAAALLTAVDERDEWQSVELHRLLEAVTSEAAVNGLQSDEELSVAEVRALLGRRLEGRPTRANFRTGHLTICTLVPMRSVPHRVVCLLGLDDGTFPRRSTTDGDDLLARSPCVGDRDLRGEDRQLLLDAVLAARDHLVITYCGRDERTNVERPPAVPVWELLDVAESTCRAPANNDGITSVRHHVLIEHPLQPFDPRNYEADVLRATGPWSFDRMNLAGASAATGARSSPPRFLQDPLPNRSVDVIELDDLTRFLSHPVRAFLRQRLGLVLVEERSEVADAMSIELDGLQRWQVGQRLVDSLLAGADAATCRAAELARGALPPGLLGEQEIDALLSTARRLVGAVALACPDHGANIAVEADAELPSGPTLVGTVTDVVGDTVLSVTYSRVTAHHRLTAWARYLLLTAAWPDTGFQAVTIGRGDRGRLRIATIARMGGNGRQRRERALGLLDDLGDLFRRGQREPLPIFCKTSAAYAEATAHGRSTTVAVRSEWDSTGQKWDKEDRDLEHRLVLGDNATVDDLLSWECRGDEAGDRWPMDEPRRFGRYARRLWDPLLGQEKVDES